jgi:hypothetical protein
MYKNLLFFLLLNSIPAYCQMTDSKAVHFVNPYEKGKVLNGTKVGVWEYYDTLNAPALIIDYDSRKIISVTTDSSHYMVRYAGDSEWTVNSLSVPARPIGSYEAFKEHFRSAFINYFESLAEIHPAEKEEMKYGTAILQFEVTNEGIATNPKIVQNPFGASFAQTMLQAFGTFPDLWIPATDLKGEPVESLFALNFVLCYNDCDFNPAKQISIYGRHLLNHTLRAKQPGKLFSSLVRNNFSPSILWSDDNNAVLVTQSANGVLNAKIIDLNGHLLQSLFIPFAASVDWLAGENSVIANVVNDVTWNVVLKYSITEEKLIVLQKNRNFPVNEGNATRVAWVQSNWGSEQISIYDVLTGIESTLPHQRQTYKNRPIKFSKDGKRLLYQEIGKDVKSLVLYDLETGNKFPKKSANPPFRFQGLVRG